MSYSLDVAAAEIVSAVAKYNLVVSACGGAHCVVGAVAKDNQVSVATVIRHRKIMFITKDDHCHFQLL